MYIPGYSPVKFLCKRQVCSDAPSQGSVVNKYLNFNKWVI